MKEGRKKKLLSTAKEGKCACLNDFEKYIYLYIYFCAYVLS